ncbi:hypothetical protein ACEQPO_27255 [Bacillus sp. SL00103]
MIGLFYVHPHVETIPWTFHIICFSLQRLFDYKWGNNHDVQKKWVNQFESFIEGAS